MTVIESEHYEADSFDAQQLRQHHFRAARPPDPPSSTRRTRACSARCWWRCTTAGMSIPQDVSVLSCGTYFEGEPTRFPITEMPVMPEELCAEAVNLLALRHRGTRRHQRFRGSSSNPR